MSTSEVTGPVSRLHVIFGDQLFPLDDGLPSFDPDHDAVLMMEVDEESLHIPVHKQRIAIFLSAMRHYAEELREIGYRVRYVTLDDPDNTHDLDAEFRRAVRELEPDAVRIISPGEWRILERVEAWRDAFAGEFELADDNHFLLPIEEFRTWADGRRELVMEHFYRMMRKQLEVLVDSNGKPVGGDWNFDRANREPFRGAPEDLPPLPAFEPDELTRDVLEAVERRFPDSPGSLESFSWPVTREHALESLDDFLECRISNFGRYQDAMVTGQPWMYHSLVSPLLNLKLLDPREVVEGAIEALANGDAPIESVEGFVRQIIGWREFIRGVYWTEGPEYGDRNELDQHGDLPEFYWTGETDMKCVRECVGEVLENGYGHHIQRLMVTGNYALISGVHPRAISDWYLGMYVDAVDWVTLPNTLGMVMHADGGRVGTKPYASTGNYIKKMSDYCAGCTFDPKRRTGDEACPFTTFYWDFLDRNRERFSRNRRMGFAMKNLSRIEDDELDEIRERADELRKKAP